MKIWQNQITGTQTSFSTKIGDKLSFILSFFFFFLSASTAVTYIIVPLPFMQQTVEYLIKFEILSSTLDMLILKISTGNGYIK